MVNFWEAPYYTDLTFRKEYSNELAMLVSKTTNPNSDFLKTTLCDTSVQSES